MGKTRKICGLKWAVLSDLKPGFACESPRKAKGSVRQGHSYEKQFGQFLDRGRNKETSSLLLGQWIRFEDSNGLGWAQPDAILLTQKAVYIFECKLTETTTGWVQLSCLYLPLIETLFPNRPIKRVQVCKNLRLGGTLATAPVVSGPEKLTDLCIWNWRQG